VEIGGNHTDHQRGRVLAAAINLETTAAVIANNSGVAEGRQGDGSSVFCLDLAELDVRPGEKGTSAALVRGVAAWFVQNGYNTGGFDAELSSTIPIGVGLSSSAAFEVLIGTVLKNLYGADISPLEIARAGQYAENVYFGKPCGLMDQAASAYGGLNIFDFEDPLSPVVTPVNAVLPGYSICVVDTGGSHADLTADYEAITSEMRKIAEYFGKSYLREVHPDVFFSSVGNLRKLGDRAVLRALHFFQENERVYKQADALKRGDMEAFFEFVMESGRSSLACLQNTYRPSAPQEQGLTLALSLSEKLLAGKGAWRVHGGGFAGTILAFVPDDLKERYSRMLCDVFGGGCCHFLSIRSEGSREVY